MRTILTDIRRWWHWRLFFIVAGTAASFFFSLEYRGISSSASVLGLFNAASNMSGQILTYVFCMCSYALSILEDLEHQYIRYAVLRSGLYRYVISKTVWIFLSSILTMICGGLLFVCFCSFFKPTVTEFEIQKGFGLFGTEEFGGLLKSGHYILYFTCCLFMAGLLAGLLSLLSAYCSLFIQNKVMAVVLPVAFYQLLCEFGSIKWISPYMFHVPGHVFGPNWLQVAYPVGFSISGFALITVALTVKIEKSM